MELDQGELSAEHRCLGQRVSSRSPSGVWWAQAFHETAPRGENFDFILFFWWIWPTTIIKAIILIPELLLLILVEMGSVLMGSHVFVWALKPFPRSKKV